MLRVVPDEMLGEVLPLVEQMFETSMHKCQHWDSFDRITALLESERAFLAMPETMDGFVILRPDVEPVTNIPFLIVDWSYHQGQDGLTTYYPQIEQMAKLAGLKFLQVTTRRKGYQRMAPKLGLEPYATTYRKEIGS